MQYVDYGAVLPFAVSTWTVRPVKTMHCEMTDSKLNRCMYRK